MINKENKNPNETATKTNGTNGAKSLVRNTAKVNKRSTANKLNPVRGGDKSNNNKSNPNLEVSIIQPMVRYIAKTNY